MARLGRKRHCRSLRYTAIQCNRNAVRNRSFQIAVSVLVCLSRAVPEESHAVSFAYPPGRDLPSSTCIISCRLPLPLSILPPTSSSRSSTSGAAYLHSSASYSQVYQPGSRAMRLQQPISKDVKASSFTLCLKVPEPLGPCPLHLSCHSHRLLRGIRGSLLFFRW